MHRPTHPTHAAPLEPGTGPVRGAYVPAAVDDVLWGRLPCAADAPVLTVEPGAEVTFDTISHEGILEDQGRDPRAFSRRTTCRCSPTRSPWPPPTCRGPSASTVRTW